MGSAGCAGLWRGIKPNGSSIKFYPSPMENGPSHFKGNPLHQGYYICWTRAYIRIERGTPLLDGELLFLGNKNDALTGISGKGWGGLHD
jgi:hypothetical protein